MTTPYQNILCPVDFSDISRLALAWSVELSKDLGGELTVLHAVDTALVNIGNLVAVPDGVGELRRESERQMASLTEGIDLSSAKVVVEEGAPADVIVNATEAAEPVDLLVMGTHGLSGLQRLLLGSVMEKVLHRVKVPLLSFCPTVPNWRAPKRILLAVDFGPEAESVVRHGVWLAEHYGAKLVGAHAVPVPYIVLNDRSMERLTPEQLETLKDTLTSERREELAGLFPASTTPVEIVSTVGSAYRAMLDAVEQHQIDLIVMGRGGHGRSNLGWVGSTCHKIVRSSPCPVLIVPE